MPAAKLKKFLINSIVNHYDRKTNYFNFPFSPNPQFIYWSKKMERRKIVRDETAQTFMIIRSTHRAPPFFIFIFLLNNFKKTKDNFFKETVLYFQSNQLS